MGLPLRFAAGAARKAWLAWRERRLDLSPAMVATHLRNYYAEMTERRAEVLPWTVRPVIDRPTVAAPTRETSRSRFLVITNAVPTPDRDSGSVRLFQILRLLCEIGHDVTLIADASGAGVDYLDDLRAIGVTTLVGFPAALEHLRTEGPGYRHVVLSRPEVAFRYLFPVRECAVHARVAYDTVDLHALRFERGAILTGDDALRRKAESYRRLESFATQSADVVIAVSEAEREIIQSTYPAATIAVIPNIHPVQRRSVEPNGRRDLLFVGSFWHQPNEDAVRYCVDEILPRIRRQLPDVRLIVAGSYVSEPITRLACESVCVKGFVRDLSPLFDECRAFVAPLRYGAGMKGKIGQSMSFGLPVVTTSIGAEGLEVEDHVHVRIADGAEAFAEAVVNVYTDEGLWNSLSSRSISHVRRHLSDTSARARLERLFPAEAVTDHGVSRS